MTMILINTTENDDNCGRQFRIVICFRDHGAISNQINQDFLLA